MANEDFTKALLAAVSVKEGAAEICPQALAAKLEELGLAVVEKTPSRGKLISMALRHDNGLFAPADETSPFCLGVTVEDRARRIQQTIFAMQSLHEEVVGEGFYAPNRESYYAGMEEA